MNQLLTFLICTITIVSCSDDSSVESLFPSEPTLSDTHAKIGDNIEITGKGFLLEGDYTITFSNNVIGSIVETNESYLMVSVPEGTVSGNVELSFQNII